MATILVVDDEPSMRLAVSEHLRRGGHEVASAANGQEALKLMAETSYDLLITDILMPEKEGIETIRDVRRLHPETKIIAISGGGRYDAGDYYLSIASQFGTDATLAKPFSGRELMETVARVLNVP